MAGLSGLKDASGKFLAYAWPGGYPMFYLDAENDVLCPDCTNENDVAFDPPIVAGEVHWEGAPLVCSKCDRSIESAYGDPDEEDNEALRE